MFGSLGDRIAAVAALDEPTRRGLYEYVVRSPDPVGRDEAAEALGIRRATAAFHLDRLVREGLLEVVHERLTGRTGPGAGRPAKLYFRSGGQVYVALPGRRYDLAGHLLADAMEHLAEADAPAEEVLAERARDHGRRLVREATEGAAGELVDVLEACDFEPRREGDTLVLGNCPFHVLAAEHTDLVCTMNLHLVEGMVEESGASGVSPRLHPRQGYCCVDIVPEG